MNPAPRDKTEDRHVQQDRIALWQRRVVGMIAGALAISLAYATAFAQGGPDPTYGDGGGGINPAVGAGAGAAVVGGAVIGGAGAAVSATAGAAAGAAGAAGAAAAGIPTAGLALGPNGQLLDLPPCDDCIDRIRIIPDNPTIVAGASQEFDVIGRCSRDRRWYRVTPRRELALTLSGDPTNLVRIAGTKSTFAVPMGMAQGLQGKTFTLQATYTVKNQEALLASVEITVRSTPAD